MKLLIEYSLEESGTTDTNVLQPLQSLLSELPKVEVERILAFLKHWNDKRPASAD